MLHSCDLLPFQRGGDYYNKWLAVTLAVVGRLYLKKKKRNKTALAVMNGLKAMKKIIEYYPQHRRYACVHPQKRHGLIAATCVFCAESA